MGLKIEVTRLELSAAQLSVGVTERGWTVGVPDLGDSACA
jgi:hypothetical protein